MTTPTQVQETDGSDESDHDAQEQALGAAFTALLIAALIPGPASFFTTSTGRTTKASWDDQVYAAVAPVVQGFLQRSAADIASDSDVAGSSAIAMETAEQVFPMILSWIQDNLAQTLQNLTDSGVKDATLAQQATTAAENLARGAAVYAKSEVREQTAGKLGAVWKIWKSRHDDRVRPTHVELNGQSAPFNGHFIVDGVPIRYPGDPKAPIDLTAGCRCHLNYKLHKDDFGDI